MSSIVRYHGGKVRMAPKIVRLFPAHQAYVEPFAGGAAVLLAKPRSRLEVYNDLDGGMVNLFRCLRDCSADLAAAVALTPYARDEYEVAFLYTEDPVELARRFLIRSHFAHGSGGIGGTSHRSSGFRAVGLRAGTLPAHIWANLPEAIRQTAERLRGVVIENRPAIQVMKASDTHDSLFYVDPPYLPETRERIGQYRHEMTRAQHIELLEFLRTMKARVVLSGYASALYDDMLADWRRIEVRAHADRGSARVEVLWLNFADRLALDGAI